MPYLNSQVLSNLNCFRSAAKHLSFTAAAEEQHLTQGAVSHRIKKLEQQLGFALFLRFNRRLQLTAEGQQLLQMVDSSLSQLELSIRDIHEQELSGELVISAPPSFAFSWLCPHLKQFQQQFPQLKLKLETHNRLIDFYNDKVDLAIYYSHGDHPGLKVWKLREEALIPVCSPQYAEEHQLQQQVGNLQHCCFLHDAQAWPEAGIHAEWQFWAQQQKMSLDLKNSYCFDISELAIQAAIAGTGIALGRELLIQQHLERGDLIAPFPTSTAARQGYFLVSHPDRQQHPAGVAFRNWLQESLI